jgi:hypothetical protein
LNRETLFSIIRCDQSRNYFITYGR